MLAVDTETNHTRWFDGTSPLFLIQWSDDSGDDCCAASDKRGVARFLRAVNAHDDLVFANAPFDVHMLRACGVVDLVRSRHRILDVQTLARVVLPERQFKGYKLKDLGRDLLGADATAEQDHLKELLKSIGLRSLNTEGAHRALWDVYPRELEAYGMKDTRLTYDLYKLLWRQATPTDRRIFMDIEMAVQRELLHAEELGALVDKPQLVALRADLERQEREAKAALLEFLPEDALGADGVKANQKALRQGLIDAGVPLYRTTDKSGELATNKDALSEFEDSCPVVGKLFAWRKLTKLLSTYIAPLERANPRVHARFLTCEARTSRMSCREPNMQNLPRAEKGRVGVRSIIIPAPGNALCVCDYDSIEMRNLAHYLERAVGFTQMREALESGVDHNATAARVFGHLPPGRGGPSEELRLPGPLGLEQPPAALLAWYDKGGPGDAQRTLAKTTTFSCVPTAGTEILTRRGWLRHDEVRVGDETLGHQDGRAVWTRVTAVHHPGDREVVTWGTKWFQMRCTREHRWLADHPVRPYLRWDKEKDRGVYGPRQPGPARMVPYADLASEDRIILSLPAEGGSAPITPDEAAIVAWILTDGSLRIAPLTGHRSQAGGARQLHCATISQTKEPHRANLRELLARTGALQWESEPRPGHSVFALRSAYVRELWRRAGLGPRLAGDLTAFVLGLSSEARAAFVAAGMAAEGCGNTWSQNEGPVLEGFTLAFHLEGHRASVRHKKRPPNANFEHYGVRLAKPRVTMQHKQRRVLSEDVEPVWCVTTELGTWTMRQGGPHGEIMLTGNSLYGIGYRKLSTRLGIPEVEGKVLKQSILDAIPGYWELFDAVVTRMKRVGHLRTVTGRRLDVPRGKSHVYLNSIIQGTAAEVMKLGMLAAADPLRELGYQIILVVHDELVSEGPVENAEAATAACVAAMESVTHMLDKDGAPLSDCYLAATGGWTTTSYGDAK